MEKIKYADIMALGFKEEKCHDEVYFKQRGFDYVIISKKLTNRIHLSWAKETRVCEIYRCNKKGHIHQRRVIKDLLQLKNIIEFFRKTC